LIKCAACGGSGRYDHNGSPKCGACDGKGKVKPYEAPVLTIEDRLSKAVDQAKRSSALFPKKKARGAEIAASSYGVSFQDVIRGMKQI